MGKEGGGRRRVSIARQTDPSFPIFCEPFFFPFLSLLRDAHHLVPVSLEFGLDDTVVDEPFTLLIATRHEKKSKNKKKVETEHNQIDMSSPALESIPHHK